MTDELLITVYCDGSDPNNPHERYVVTQYGLEVIIAGDGRQNRIWRPMDVWSYQGRSGRTRRRGGQQYLVGDTRQDGRPDPEASQFRMQFSLYCSSCSFDYQSNMDSRPNLVGRIWKIFDGLAEGGHYEISARDLIKYALFP